MFFSARISIRVNEWDRRRSWPRTEAIRRSHRETAARIHAMCTQLWDIADDRFHKALLPRGHLHFYKRRTSLARTIYALHRWIALVPLLSIFFLGRQYFISRSFVWRKFRRKRRCWNGRYFPSWSIFQI